MCNLIIDDNRRECECLSCTSRIRSGKRGQRLIDLERIGGGERERERLSVETDRNGLVADLIPLIDQFLYDSNPPSLDTRFIHGAGKSGLRLFEPPPAFCQRFLIKKKRKKTTTALPLSAASPDLYIYIFHVYIVGSSK